MIINDNDLLVLIVKEQFDIISKPMIQRHFINTHAF